MKLLALIIAFAISHFVKNPEKFRQFDWFKIWAGWFKQKVKLPIQELTVIIVVGLPVLVISLLAMGLFNSVVGELLLAVLVLSYSIGPKSLDEEVANNRIRKNHGIRKNAQAAVVIKKMTKIAMHRWFGVFFWYVILGVVGAVLYRLSERLFAMTKESDSLYPIVKNLMKILNYPVSWVMVISLAIASDFERIYKKCVPSMKMDSIAKMDTSFLYEAADFAVENCEVDTDEKESIETITLNVLNRMLVVWLVFVSLLVILAVMR
jgi:AmpE protein